MNIFFLRACRKRSDLRKLASLYHKKHQKIILEIAQMLCTAARENLAGEDVDHLYRGSHKHHPMTLWVTASPYNALLAARIANALDARFRQERKGGKSHASMGVVREVLKLMCKHWKRMFNADALKRLEQQQTATLCPVEDWVLPVTPIPACVGGPVSNPDIVQNYASYYQSKLDAWDHK